MLTIKEFIAKHGLEALRGVKINTSDGKTLYIHNKCLDSDIALWRDETKENIAKYVRRFYGGITPDAKMVFWIYPSCMIAEVQSC